MLGPALPASLPTVDPSRVTDARAADPETVRSWPRKRASPASVKLADAEVTGMATVAASTKASSAAPTDASGRRLTLDFAFDRFCRDRFPASGGV
jgi:hypothetical protein